MATNQLTLHRFIKRQFDVLDDHIVVSDMSFERRVLNSGLILLDDNGTGEGIRPRWGKVYAVGPNQKDVAIGDWIMVKHGRWTRGFDVEDENGEHTLRRVDPNDVLGIWTGEGEPQDETFSTAVSVEKAPDHMLHT